MLNKVSKKDITTIAEQVGWFHLTEAEVDEYAALSTAVLGVIDGVEALGLDQPWDVVASADRGGDARAEVRAPGRRPLPGEDPLNAIVRWVRLQRPDVSGPLTGMRLALKDSVAISGVPMTLGSSVMRGFIPQLDSVVTERLVAAGAEIVAVANMDAFAFSGGGDTSSYGDIGNPFDKSRSAGGSSGGSAAALFYNAVDASIGCDQGGSIRLPAAWCGVLGLKPTHSLVPYTGIAGIDATFDHAGPMARTAGDLGRVLLSIAGPHASDPRQAGVHFEKTELVEVLNSEADDFAGFRVGVLAEGFSQEDDLCSRTSAAVRDFAERLASAGATVEDVSVPAHLEAGGIAFAGFMEGMAALLRGGGNGYHWSGRFSPEFALGLNAALRTRGDELPPQIKLVSILGEHLRKHYGGAVYAAAQNQRPWLRSAYDEALSGFDVLLLPTVPYPAYEHDPSLGINERTMRGWAPLANCAPTDMTGHPAISLPVATVDGLPIGAMLVGQRFKDSSLVDLACRYERKYGWDQTITKLPSNLGPVTAPV